MWLVDEVDGANMEMADMKVADVEVPDVVVADVEMADVQGVSPRCIVHIEVVRYGSNNQLTLCAFVCRQKET